MAFRHGKHKQHRGRRQNGSVLLSTLFIVIAVTTISMGYLYRADMTLASGRNLELRNQSDYLAWSGLEHARALIQGDPNIPDPNNIVWPIPDSGNEFYYELHTEEQSPTADGRKYTVTCTVVYDPVGNKSQAQSDLQVDVIYADNKTTIDSIKLKSKFTRDLTPYNSAYHLAWEGIGYARLLIQSDPNTPHNIIWPPDKVCYDFSGICYELDIPSPTVTATKRTYPVTCEAYYQVGTEKKARSYLSAKVVYLIADGKTTFNSINRQ